MDQLRLGINANDELQPNLRYNDCETASLSVPTYGQVENNQVEKYFMETILSGNC